MNARKAADEKLRESLRECMQVKNAMIDEEIQPYEDHVFSDKFEAEIKKLLVVRNKKAERAKLFKYAASVAAAILVVVGIVSASATSTKATLPSIDILGWFDTHFEFSKGVSNLESSGVNFKETQMGYIPVGFEKKGEENNFNYIKYIYENKEKEYFSIRVSKVWVHSYQNTENATSETFINDAGYECTYFIRENEHVYIWESDNGLYYYLAGNIAQNEMKYIMNGIQYEGENR